MGGALTWYLSNRRFFEQEKRDLSDNYPGLTWSILQKQVTVSGKLVFSATFNAEPLCDSYNVEIKFPYQYPDDFPRVWETGGRIPKDYHRMHNGALCLGTPVEQMERFGRNATILRFIDDLLVPYLYRRSYIELHGKDPFADRLHGVSGFIQHYKELFATSDVAIINELLLTVTNGTFKSNSPCPCGSTKSLSTCHGPILLRLKRNASQYLKVESEQINMHLQGMLKDATAKNLEPQITKPYFDITRQPMDGTRRNLSTPAPSALQLSARHDDHHWEKDLRLLTTSFHRNEFTGLTK